MRTLLLLLLLLLTAPAGAALRVLACEPEWAALARELGGEAVTVTSATHARQDPHRVQARPSLIAAARRADLLVCTGAGLEGGWLPVLLRQGANPRIQPGRPGHLAAADHVALLEVPATLDRSAGDVHPEGNPHLHLDPRRLARVAEVLGRRLAVLDPDRAAHYRARHAAFAERWAAAVTGWERRAAPLRDRRVVTQHRAWVYLLDWLGMEEAATLEPRPGLPASTVHLAGVVRALKARPAAMVIRAAYQDDRASEWLTRHVPIRAVVLPYTVGGTPEAVDLTTLFDATLDRLLAALP